ncbi:hypothetical protein CAOG_02208 [Capsaspora owczarzaki ATCC 30864]|uniref:hypothetical protein n=1 Tax=Capsaspora owczarzaki (strain ATCC 30864) TaxID=595528 RepID=UPI0001FE36F5|nr:hypothetical protein CAOG_02208 [Capsaspora owczarzaki ATCC 30864]|eukprot:XP_004348958.1 hypothetical protein CAOG_02208 [Capsaspora owczarzaki ATCC 30864]
MINASTTPFFQSPFYSAMLHHLCRSTIRLHVAGRAAYTSLACTAGRLPHDPSSRHPTITIPTFATPAAAAALLVPLSAAKRVSVAAVRMQPPARGMAGHSKWKTIKHAKAATDAKRGKLITKFSREISSCVRESGEDPVFNPRLGAIIDRARQNDVPIDKIRNAIKVAASGKEVDDKAQVHFFEARGPGNVSLLIETLTENTRRTFPEIRALLSKVGGEPAPVGYIFKRVAVVTIRLASDEDLAKLSQWDDLALEVGVHVGAEDTEADVEESTLSFICQPSDSAAVRDAATKLGVGPPMLRIDFLSESQVSIGNAETQEQFEWLMEALDDHADVMNVFDNLDRSQAE